MKDRLFARDDLGHLVRFSLLALLAMSGFALSLPLRGIPSDLGKMLIESGRLFSAGLDPYSAWLANHNSPMSLPLCAFLAGIDTRYVAWLWFAAGLAAYMLAVGLLFRAYLPRPTLLQAMWPLAIAPLWELGLGLGNIYPFLALLTAGVALAFRAHRPALAGALFGLLIAFKPNFAVVPVLLFFAGHRRPAIAASLSALGFTLLPMPVLGVEPYLQWASAVGGLRWLTAVANVSVYGVAARADAPEFGVLAAAALGLLALLFVASRRPDPQAVSVAGTALALLLSPVAWAGYTVLLLPAFYAWPQTRPVRVAAALMLVPAYAFYALWQVVPATMPLLGLVYTATLSMLTVETIRRSADHHTTSLNASEGGMGVTNSAGR